MKLKCFVAIALGHSDTDRAYERLIKPTAAAKNIDARRVTDVNHNEDIDDKILQLIGDSELMIADLTFARPSVYFEAGYAQRAGKPVIYTCRADHLERRHNSEFDNLRVHFDLEHKNIIPWSEDSEPQFCDKLAAMFDLVLAELAEKEVSHLMPSSVSLTQDMSTFVSQTEALRAQKGSSVIAEIALRAPLELTDCLTRLQSAKNDSEIGTVKEAMQSVCANLEALGATCVARRYWDELPTCGDALVDICLRAGTAQSAGRNVVPRDEVWFQVLMSSYAVGALLVHQSHWDYLKSWVLREANWEGVSRKPEYWCDRLRLELARSHFFTEGKIWLEDAVRHIESRKHLMALFANQNQVRLAVCQFDFLQCLICESEKSRDSSSPFPSFSGYDRSYVEPVLSRILNRKAVREKLLDVTDQELARILSDFENTAERSMAPFGGWPASRWGDPTIQEFLANYAKPSR